MKHVNQVLIVVAMALALTSISACEEKGPAERAGEHIDKATDNARDAGKNAGEKIGEAMEDAGEKMQGK